ncbi:MAG TPA: nucleotidyl transferase AbiEii/AbiGii toxin family protein, partial [Ignavibacteria bacterium]|nr:nucleotidyl transferase AbiEii/AbiGii toxin family protein [Ignavibacteria bacterium]
MTQNEIKHIAKQKDILKATIDKDWVLGHLLNAFYSFEDIRNSFVFKGGTCLKKCYFEDYRFSEDLDFTILDRGFPVNRAFINRIIKIAEIKSEIRFFLSEINKQFYNDIPQGYEVKIKFWGADHNPNSTIPPP